MLRPMDLWRVAIINRPLTAILAEGFDEPSVTWGPAMPAQSFRADPFGLWRDGLLHVFAEGFSYRDRRGYIDLLVYDAQLTLLDSRTVLREPWHLSYPFVFEAEGEIWMLPEAFQSGTLTLYRAKTFPGEWEAVCQIPLDGAAIDATPFFWQDRWWLFYAPSHSKRAKQSHLHIAYADRLTGPWHLHPGNPVHIDIASARPGGTPILQGGSIILPVQDCRRTYGAAIRLLEIAHLDETAFAATDRDGLQAPAWMTPYTDGLHTLSAVGEMTLLDVKRMDASLPATVSRLYHILRHKLAKAA
ncbi:formyl transferase [Acidisoma cellulosilytica]|uniref:Formyl transferase n=1 Tax=Acidisoma cellulosilyticum TaxID=2802395 RepID=A0A964E5F1_9PROT|nr:formyl transferase [Acidisoma cellulosilyticum]MCB8882449.1 formyl transferase [Acidisoma cellulosilyticum]